MQLFQGQIQHFGMGGTGRVLKGRVSRHHRRRGASAEAVWVWGGDTIQYNTIQYKTCNMPCVTAVLFVGAGMTRD